MSRGHSRNVKRNAILEFAREIQDRESLMQLAIASLQDGSVLLRTALAHGDAPDVTEAERLVRCLAQDASAWRTFNISSLREPIHLWLLSDESRTWDNRWIRIIFCVLVAEQREYPVDRILAHILHAATLQLECGIAWRVVQYCACTYVQYHSTGWHNAAAVALSVACALWLTALHREIPLTGAWDLQAVITGGGLECPHMWMEIVQQVASCCRDSPLFIDLRISSR